MTEAFAESRQEVRVTKSLSDVMAVPPGSDEYTSVESLIIQDGKTEKLAFVITGPERYVMFGHIHQLIANYMAALASVQQPQDE